MQIYEHTTHARGMSYFQKIVNWAQDDKIDKKCTFIFHVNQQKQTSSEVVSKEHLSGFPSRSHVQIGNNKAVRIKVNNTGKHGSPKNKTEECDNLRVPTFTDKSHSNWDR